jgi:uncharacterized spore protein YtfJ
MAVEDTTKATLQELQKVLSANNIIGAPVEMEDKIIVPITKMGMGFGTGSSHDSDKNVGGTSGGAGGGVGVFPAAVIIVVKGVSGHEGVRVVPIGAPSPVSGALGEIASAIMSIEPGSSGYNRMSESLGEMASAIVGRITGKKKSSETEEKGRMEKSDEEVADSAQPAPVEVK